MKNPFLRSLCATVAAVAFSLPAGAQLFRTYLSATGNDANPCTLASPCRLLPAALTAVADGGEIWMLNSGNFNIGQVNIDKSVTILAIPGAVGSVVSTSGDDAISINAPGAKVTLRNLVIVHLTSSANGVSFVDGAELHVEGCEIANVAGNGIRIVAPSPATVTVRNTVVRDVGANGIFFLSGAHGSIIGVKVSGSVSGIVISGGFAAISDSVLEGNVYGIEHVSGSFQGGGVVMIDRSVITGNASGGIYLVNIGNFGTTNVSVTRTVISGSGSAGISVSGSNAASIFDVVLEGDSITGPGIVVSGPSSVTVATRGNNNISSVTGVSLAPLPGK